MIVYWRVSTSTASVEVVRLGIHAAREHACAAILDCFPGQLHGGYAFAKQDAYKLAKVGLSFHPDSVDAGGSCISDGQQDCISCSTQGDPHVHRSGQGAPDGGTVMHSLSTEKLILGEARGFPDLWGGSGTLGVEVVFVPL